jgi:hypothetical protein
VFRHTSGIIAEVEAPIADGAVQTETDWNFEPFTVGKDAEWPQSAPLYYIADTGQALDVLALRRWIRHARGYPLDDMLAAQDYFVFAGHSSAPQVNVLADLRRTLIRRRCYPGLNPRSAV